MADVLDDADIARILAITAHPDDVDFGAAATIATWTDAGIEVAYCVVTDGDAGGQDEDFPRAEMPALRRAEQVAAAKCVGVQDVRFLGYPDGRVEATLDLRRDLARVIRQVRPDRVVCPSPERNYARIPASHPDHRAVGSAALDAVYPDARNPFAFPELHDREGLAPWTVRAVTSYPQVLDRAQEAGMLSAADVSRLLRFYADPRRHRWHPGPEARTALSGAI